MIVTRDRLGIGIYTIAEAAFYARVSERMMKRWVFGDSQGKPAIKAELSDPDDKVVTFLDFVQTLAIREVRQRHKLSLQRIRQGVEQARLKYDVEYPLAREHCIFLFSDGRREGHGHIVIRLKGDVEGVEDQYVQLTGNHKGCHLMKQVVEMFLDDLRFDPITQLATEYRPLSENGVSVLMNPHRRFGEPVIEPTGYTAEALWHATNTEGSIQAVADTYGVSLAEVAIANKYYGILMPGEAA